MQVRLRQGVLEALSGCPFGASFRIFPAANGRVSAMARVPRLLPAFRRFRPRYW